MAEPNQASGGVGTENEEKPAFPGGGGSLFDGNYDEDE